MNTERRKPFGWDSIALTFAVGLILGMVIINSSNNNVFDEMKEEDLMCEIAGIVKDWQNGYDANYKSIFAIKARIKEFDDFKVKESEE